MARSDAAATGISPALLLSVTEELRLPLLRLARQAEQAHLTGVASNPAAMSATADAALALLDNYSLAVRLALEPQQLPLESVSVASVLYDTGQALDALAKQHGVELELSIGGKFGPVTAHRAGLQAALTSLGAALIEALPAHDVPQLRLQLATHASRYGIVAGLYADHQELQKLNLSKARQLQSMSRQPFNGLSHSSGAGIFVADTILRAMDLELITSRHHRLHGLGTVLQANNQLQLV